MPESSETIAGERDSKHDPTFSWPTFHFPVLKRIINRKAACFLDDKSTLDANSRGSGSGGASQLTEGKVIVYKNRSV